MIAQLWLSVPVYAQGQGPTGATSLTVSVNTTSTPVNLTAPSSSISIANTTSNNVYFSEISPATSAQGAIYPGSAYNYSGTPITSFYLIAPTGVSSVAVIAH